MIGFANHIVVVDDQEAVRMTVAALLRSRSYTTTQVATGREALGVLANSPVDLVVLDLGLQGEDGLSILAAIKDSHPDVRVVILTGRGYDNESWEVARQRGADGYISKGIPPSQLLIEVNKWMRRKQAQPETELE